MAVKRATTTRRPASRVAAGKPAKGSSAKGLPAVKGGRSRATKSAVSSRQAAAKQGAAKRGTVKRPAAQPGAVRSSGTRGKQATKPGAARTAPKHKVATGARGPAVRAPKLLSGAERVVRVVEEALDEMKAVQVKVLDVRQLTDFADTLVIASGNSDRHVRSIAERVVEHAKKVGLRAMGIEGLRDGEWVLVDLQDVIVHVMLPRIRELYRLEDLWDVSAARREAASEKVAV